MTTAEIIKKVEETQDICERIQNHVHDIGDVDYMIEELKHKRKVYERRLRRDSEKLATVLKDKDFVDNCTDSFIEEINYTLSYVKELSHDGC